MNNSNNLPNFNQANADQDSLSLPQIIQIVRRNWAIFAICIFLSGFFAYLFLRYARPVYMSKASVLIKTSQGAESNIQESIVKEIGLGGSNKMLENEVQIFKSRTLMEHAVRSLGMEVSMESEGRVKNSQFFNLSSPVQIDTYSISPKALPANFRLEIKDSSNFTLSNDTKSVEGKFGQLTRIDSFSFVANYVNPIEEMPFTILLHFNTVNVIAERLSNKLKVVSDIEKGNVLELGLEDEVPSRANALLDSLITFYNKLGIEESNQVALNTIDFIDDRLQYISGELTDVEGGLQSFKEKNKTLGLSNEGELLLENLSAYDKEVATLEIQKEILKNIQKYLSDDQKAFDYVPTNLGLTNLTLVGLLEQFNMLLSQRLRLSSTAGESNPRWLEINAQIESIRSKIIQNINSIQQDFNVALQKTQNKARELQSRVRAAPKMERQFLEIRRQQNIKESLYLFLLQKREEAALSLAMTVPNAQIIDPANNTVKPIRPMKFNIFLIAMAIGLIVSSIIIYLRETLNTKIEDENDLTSLTSVPLLGRISKNSQKTSIVVTKESRTIIAESFKALRTNLNFIKNDNPSTVISITSTISGEGKSFISINLALAYAALDKKVALVGMDLRKPKLTDYLEESNPLEGVSTYLAGRSNFESILFKTNIGENITLVPSGPIPPNPNELLQNDRLKVLIDELRSRFDYIIIDTSPVGLVSDAIIISEFADQTLYIIRKSYTEKGALKLLNELYISHKVKGLGIVLNGITSNNRYGSYSYSNQKYYTYYDSEERGLMAKVKSFLRIK